MRRVVLFILLMSAVASLALAQTPTQQQPPRGQMPDLGRPTKHDDKLPLFDFDSYFVGKWTFEWDMPDGPLGPAGRLEGTTVYTALGKGAVTSPQSMMAPLQVEVK